MPMPPWRAMIFTEPPTHPEKPQIAQIAQIDADTDPEA